MMRLACMTLPYAHVSLERALEGIARAGYRYVAFGLPHEGREVLDDPNEEQVKALRQQFDRWELEPVMLVGTKALAPGQSKSHVHAYLTAAKSLGVEEVLSLGTWGYRTFPDEPLPQETLQKEHQAFVNAFREWAEIAAALNLRLTIKPHTGNTATAQHLKNTLRDIGSDVVQACYDPGNIHHYEGIDSAKDFTLIAAQTASLIAKDHRGSRAEHDFPLPGEGDVPFVNIFRQLKAVNFSGPIVVERVDGAQREPMSPAEIDRRILAARRNLERLMEQAGFPPAEDH